MKATAKDLRFHSKELLETVKRGEEVVITYRGRPCAKLVPFSEGKKRKDIKRNELFGIWENNKDVENVEKYVSDLRKSRF